MHWMTRDLVQRHKKVKSNVTAPDVDGYGPMISDSHGVINILSPMGQNLKFYR